MMIFKSRDPTPSEWLRGAASPLGGRWVWCYGMGDWAGPYQPAWMYSFRTTLFFFLMTCNKHIPGHT